jgi:DNA mismatch repair ATPase MutL
MDWQTIVVSSKILGHISAGVYRSPAGAIKELVSNAFDANATRVAITTNWPSFDIITCRDNGSGMTPEQFRQIMQGGIGGLTNVYR